MKRICRAAFAAVTVLCVLGSVCMAMAAEIPSLRAVSFKNATVQEALAPDRYEYTLVLDDPKQTPTLENYEVSGDAKVFTEYLYDSTQRQNGIAVTLEHENGSVKYRFLYQNAQRKTNSSNNYLQSVSCPLGVVYPEISHDTDRYRLYVPSDLTELELSAAPEDVEAHCEVPGTITLSAQQEMKIVIQVTAADGSVRPYTFRVRRMDKTSQEAEQLIREGNTDLLIKSERFYQKPAFLICFFGILGSALLLWLLVNLTKRFAVQVGDSEEVPFFAEEETEE